MPSTVKRGLLRSRARPQKVSPRLQLRRWQRRAASETDASGLQPARQQRCTLLRRAEQCITTCGMQAALGCSQSSITDAHKAEVSSQQGIS